MMRGRKSAAVAVRRRDGEIVVRNEPVARWATGRIREIPLLRGPIVLLETLILGMRSLSYSASVAVEEEDQKLHPAILWSTMAFGFILAVGLFVALPLLIIHFLDPYISATVSNISDGVIRLVVFIGYLNLVSLMPDIRRVFAYHGAEHATINAYEAGEELEVDKVRGYGTAHARCGTGFILMVLVIAVIAHAFLGRPPMWVRFLERLAILPIIGAFSYEMMKFSADHIKNRLVHLAIIPGLVLQRMTTRKPDDSQLEVAITALKSVLAADAEPSE